jgi:glycosyltransferase involved in cell wall biosynthesis
VRVVTDPRERSRLAWMQMTVPRLLETLEADIAHFTNGMIPLALRPATRAVVTIHDMSLTLFPRYHPLRRVVLNRPQVRWSASRAAAVITVSHSAQHDIAALYGLPPERVHVIHEAAAPSFRPVRDPVQLARVRARYGLADRFVLYVGTIEPRKNLARLIDAFARRHRTGDLPHQLVCAGPYGWLSRDIARQLERLGIADAIRFVGYVPFDDLPALYSASEMFVFPSLYEGFGLPVIEAMACGAPVIAARAASLMEIAQDAVDYVDALDVDALGDALVALARDPARRADRSARGAERAQLFSWDRAAEQTYAIYQSVAYGMAMPAPARVDPRHRLPPSIGAVTRS